MKKQKILNYTGAHKRRYLSLSPFVKIANDKLVYQRDSTESEKELALIGTQNKKNYYKQTNKRHKSNSKTPNVSYECKK